MILVGSILVMGITFYMAGIYGSTSLALLGYIELTFVVVSIKSLVGIFKQLKVSATTHIAIQFVSSKFIILHHLPVKSVYTTLGANPHGSI